jgi:hypothetical protein
MNPIFRYGKPRGIHMLLHFLISNRSKIIPRLCQRIRQTTPTYEKLPVLELEERVTKGVDAFLMALQDGDLAPLDHFIAETVVSRTVEEFPLAILHAGFTVFGELLLPLLSECYGNNTACLVAELQRLHLLKDAILQRLVEQYETQAPDSPKSWSGAPAAKPGALSLSQERYTAT